ncbi:MAG: insulinase family protein [Treponema sp.]|jgi:Zn-dependent M16 (insulinase) family peptidase|nr:insulinase family protein [Treponema sp.]
MKTTLQAGDTASGFEVLETVDLAELRAEGIWARHRKSGAEVFHIYNEDPENLFAFCFATSPEDSTGAAHILEHSVFCGSKRYPLKDPFLVLMQGSLQTFLNAMTFPDRTIYPASSVNEQDYFNLMSVYGDAVFYPLLPEWVFRQEGHRVTFSPSREKRRTLAITGVVYNEMKGAYSSLDDVAGGWSFRALMPGTPMAFESGGDPDHIPELGWEALKAFHRSRYNPANCRIFLAGNIPTEKQLAFLDETFLRSLEAGKAAPPPVYASRWTAPRTLRISCAAGGDSKPTVFLSWLCGKPQDMHETLALAALTEVLLGHDGSPLNRALVESGLGEDLSPVTGLEVELPEIVFTAGLRGVQADEAAVEKLILDTLRKLADEGIPQEEIEAAMLSIEFANREIRRAGGPYSLVWLSRSLRGWSYGAKPWETILVEPALAQLKARLAGGPYFEGLIRKYLLDNPHRARISLIPEADYLPKKEAARAAVLAKKAASMGDAEFRALAEQNAALEKIQEEPDSPEALAAIPHLSRKDLSPEPGIIPRELGDCRGLPVLSRELFTNGISYLDLAFPLDRLEAEDYLWLPFFSQVVVSVGLPGMDYAAVSSLMARTLGSFAAGLSTGSLAQGSAATVPLPGGILDIGGRDWIIYQLKTLDEKLEPSLDLALRMISEADFSDPRRIRDLVLEMKNSFDSGLAPSGHELAAGRANRSFSRTGLLGELWRGISQLEFAHRLVETDTAEIIRRLERLRDSLLTGGCIANLTGSGEALKEAARCLGGGFSRFGPPRPRGAAVQGTAAFTGLKDGGRDRNEVYVSPSLQVGFAALTIPGAPYPSREHAAELVLAHQLSTGPLWEDIRMKGGAYGAFAAASGIEAHFGFSSYRDPDPLRSLGAFRTALETLAKMNSEDALEKAIIGHYGKENYPRTAREQGSIDFSRFLYGIEDRHRERKMAALIGLSLGETSGAARRLAQACTDQSVGVIIAGRAAAEAAAASLGVSPRELPV